MQSYTFDATQKNTDSLFAKSLDKVMQTLRPDYVGEKSDAKLYHDSLAIVLQEEPYIFVFPDEGQEDDDSLEDMFQCNNKRNKQKHLKEEEKQDEEKQDEEKQEEKIEWNTYAGLMQFHRIHSTHLASIREDEIY